MQLSGVEFSVLVCVKICHGGELHIIWEISNFAMK